MSFAFREITAFFTNHALALIIKYQTYFACFFGKKQYASCYKLEGNFIFTFLTQALDVHYTAVRVLKTGARGTVTLLRHIRSGQPCILRQFQGSAAVYEKLLPIRSPHLPQVLAVGERDGQVLVLEEYVQGDSLDELLEGAVCTVRQTKAIAMDVCKALWILHSLGTVHRDVKPENILLRGKEAVLIDFDASRVVTPEQKTDTVVLGTTGYAPPEQYGISQTDGRADIYSLGVTMNIMLTGQHPSRKLAAGRLGHVIQRCTMLAPEKRYQSVLELMEAL